jgi:PleD family two-component response regulator
MMNSDQLMGAADNAMYSAKRAGKDRILVSAAIPEDCLVGGTA